MNDEKYYECLDCKHCRYNMATGEHYCRRSYTDVSPDQSACDDFELDEQKGGLTVIDEAEVIERIKCNCFTGNPEEDHENADNILCDFLRLLGYEELVDVYESVSRWYS